MSETTAATPSARHWKDIPQEITPRAMSRVGRRRLTMRTIRNITIGVVSFAAAFGAYQLLETYRHSPERLAGVSGARPVQHIEVETDGVLSSEWVKDVLQLRSDVGLMELDLYALRARLLEHRQIKSAVLKRVYPDTLRVVLEERTPVVRLKAQLDGPDLKDFLVSPDGVVFTGQGFDAGSLGQLPWLGGVRLVRADVGFSPLAGMDRVADLLSTARGNVPDLYDTWRVVSLERFARDGQILVQSSEVPEIIFGVREDFYTQVARLDVILDETHRRRTEPLRSINLAVGASQVPVALNISIGSAGKAAGSAGINFPLRNR